MRPQRRFDLQEGIPEVNNVFAGPDGIKHFLHPDHSQPAPLVELPDRLNPFAEQRVRIFAKLMYLLPLLNLKSFPALRMLEEASDRLEGVHTIVESSSGNTAFSLAVIAPLFGVRRVRAVVPVDLAPGKLELLRLAGAEVRFAPPECSGVGMARRMGERAGFLNLDQYSNSANIEAHAKWTTCQVWEQTQRKLTVYCAGLGTTGTALGAIRFFDENATGVTVVGVYCLPNNAVPGVRDMARLHEVSFDWETEVPHRVGAGTHDSYKQSLALCRTGLMAGPSSGFALAGLLRFLREQPDLDEFRNSDGEVVAAFLCCDTPFPYLDKYSTILDPADFMLASTEDDEDW